MSTREMQSVTARHAGGETGSWGFSEVCSLIEEVLSGSARAEILSQLEGPKDLAGGVLRLRRSMREHVFRVRGGDVDLSAAIAETDRRTRSDGLNVLHDWDGTAEVFNPDVIPVDVAE